MREKKDINIEVGEQVKIARENAHLTQEQLAERIDVSPHFISDLERGVVGIALATLKRLCLSLGVSSDQILFSAESEDRFSALADRCRGLSEEQFVLLSDIVTKFVEAIELERQKR